jgi:D-alanyl-D-alanine dipeptidase
MPFAALSSLRDAPIPDLGSARGYRTTPIDFAGARNHEALVDAKAYGVAGENYYAATRNPPYYGVIPGAIDAIILRQGVAERLARVNEKLNAADLELFAFDGWRPQAVQAYFHDVWLPAELRRRRPDISETDLLAEVETYWAAPTTDRASPSPHSTGGAVDLTIRWRDGGPLWMGSLFDDASPLAHTARFEKIVGEFSFSDEEARANRRLLYWLLRDAGFAANPTEWWHFSHGDQMWAKLTGEPIALYAGADYAESLGA